MHAQTYSRIVFFSTQFFLTETEDYLYWIFHLLVEMLPYRAVGSRQNIEPAAAMKLLIQKFPVSFCCQAYNKCNLISFKAIIVFFHRQTAR